MLGPMDFFDLRDEGVRYLFRSAPLVWDLVANIEQIVEDLVGGRRIINGDIHPRAELSDGPLIVEDGVRVEPGVYIQGPAYLGRSVVVRHGAYVRGHCAFLQGSVLGHASEAKNALFLPHAKAPHFAYVGDSVLGHRVNLGAGTKLSNMPIASGAIENDHRRTIAIAVDGRSYDTGLTKLGAILGDEVQTGCNAVLNPGCVLGPRSLVYPNATVPKGYHRADTIIKLRQVLQEESRR